MPSSLNEFNNQPIGVLQNNLTTINGIFAFLKNLNNGTRTRYSIKSYEKEGYPNGCLDDYYGWTENTRYWSTNDNKNISITFNSLFLLSGYAISNAVIAERGNSYPSGWKLIGVDVNTGKNVVLDKQENQTFCGESNLCVDEFVKGYRVNHSYKAFKEFIFEQTAQGANESYLFIRSIDLFGTLCGLNNQCDFHFYELTCKMKERIEISINVIIILVFLIK